jgi:thioredoxin reductase
VVEHRHVRVLVIGGGPAGLAAATRLAATGFSATGDVLVLEREARAGGVPRHCDHTGFGLRDLRRVLRGPAYAEAWRARAAEAGAEIVESAMVTGWVGERAVAVTSPHGRFEVSADAVILATGARERPRPGRRIPGDRAAGVMTTGQLQQLVHLHGRSVGKRAVVVGGELVSWSAVMTLREAGCRTVAMTTPYEKAEAYSVFRLAGRTALRVPVHPRTRVVEIRGRGRVGEVVLEHLDTGRRQVIECDTVVMTGDWVPDHELARSAGLALDPATLGPVVDTALRTSEPGVFAVGNLLHPVDTADIAALDGEHVVSAVRDWVAARSAAAGVAGAPAPADAEAAAAPVPATATATLPQGVAVSVAAPLRWIVPQRVDPDGGAPARDRLLTWCDDFVLAPVVEVSQGGRVVGRHRIWWSAAPGRVFRLPASVLEGVRSGGGDVQVRLAGR